MASIKVFNPKQNPALTYYQGNPDDVVRDVVKAVQEGEGHVVLQDGDLHLVDGLEFPREVFPDWFTPTGEVVAEDPSGQVEADIAAGALEPADETDVIVPSVPEVSVQIVPGSAGRINVIVENTTGEAVTLWRDTGTVGTIDVKAGETVNRSYKPPVDHETVVRRDDADGVIVAWFAGEAPLVEVSADEEPAAAAGVVGDQEE